MTRILWTSVFWSASRKAGLYKGTFYENSSSRANSALLICQTGSVRIPPKGDHTEYDNLHQKQKPGNRRYHATAKIIMPHMWRHYPLQFAVRQNSPIVPKCKRTKTDSSFFGTHPVKAHQKAIQETIDAMSGWSLGQPGRFSRASLLLMQNIMVKQSFRLIFNLPTTQTREPTCFSRDQLARDERIVGKISKRWIKNHFQPGRS